MPDTDKGRSECDRHVVGRRELLRGAVAASIAAGAVGATTSARAVIWEEGEEQCRASTKEKSPSYDIDDALLADFMRVSRTLTGVPLSSPADLRLGREYLERYARLDVPGIDLRKLITGHGESAEAIMKNTDLRPAAEQLIYLWYLSAFLLPTVKPGEEQATPPPDWIYGTTEQYEHGLLWTAIGAHAPMMPMRGSKENYWAEPGRLPYKANGGKGT
jgi:hypothetical protein